MGNQGLPFIHVVLNSFLAINHHLENHGMMIESLLISQRLETLSIVALDIQLIPHHHHNDHHNHHFVISLRLKTFIVVFNIQPKNFIISIRMMVKIITIIIILWFHFDLKHFLTGASIFRQGLSQESGNSSSPRWSLDPLAPPLTMQWHSRRHHHHHRCHHHHHHHL